MKNENIKFKAKRLDNGGWVEGDFVHSLDGSLNIFGFTIKNGIKCFSGAYRIAPSTICQFTGAKDCDGTSIYEHDLLRHEKTDSTYEVVWNQGNTSFSLVNTEYPVLYSNTFGRMLHNRRLKVVGNRFDKEK